MGSLTCGVMVGFLALHFGVIMCVIALGTPYWLNGNLHTDPNRTHPMKNHTIEDQTKGLWQFCIEPKNCTALNQTIQPTWFEAVQGLQVSGVALGVLTIVLTYSMLMAEMCKNSAKLAGINAALQVLAVDCILTTLIIFGVKSRDDNTSGDFPGDFDLEFGWSYDIDIAGCCCLFISALLALRNACFFAKRRTGYENI